jgi:hypothetical protein
MVSQWKNPSHEQARKIAADLFLKGSKIIRFKMAIMEFNLKSRPSVLQIWSFWSSHHDYKEISGPHGKEREHDGAHVQNMGQGNHYFD